MIHGPKNNGKTDETRKKEMKEKIKSLNEMMYERNKEELYNDFPDFPKGFSIKQIETIGKMSGIKDSDFKRASTDGAFDELYRKKKTSKSKSKRKICSCKKK